MAIHLRDVTPNDAANLAHVLITSSDGVFRGLVPEACLAFTEAQSVANWERMLAQGLDEDDFMLLAEADGAVVGYAWGGPAGEAAYRGELRQLMVLPSHQRLGIGRLLVRQVTRRLAAQGIHSMRVEAVRDNPNRAFYERLGARYVSEHPYDWDGYRTMMYVYGWADTRPLLDG